MHVNSAQTITTAGELVSLLVLPQEDGTVAIASAHFPNVYLRLDGTGVTSATEAGGGIVNCQYGVGPWAKFRLEQQADGAIAIASAEFPNLYLRLDGRGVTPATKTGGGIVNCQYGVGPWEEFRLDEQPADGTIAIASVQFQTSTSGLTDVT